MNRINRELSILSSVWERATFFRFEVIFEPCRSLTLPRKSRNAPIFTAHEYQRYVCSLDAALAESGIV